MSDTKVRAIDTERPIVKEDRGRRLLYGTAAAVVALVVGSVAWFALAGGGDEPAPEEAATGGDPIELIETFYEKWSAGDISGALELGKPGDWTSDLLFIEPTMRYTVAIEPDGWFWSVYDCSEQVAGTYNCGLALVGDPLLDALGLSAGRGQFSIEDGKLTEVELGSWMRAADRELATYAEQQDPIGYEAACVGSNGRAWEENGVVYNRECGAFLSTYLEALAADLAAG